MPLVIVTGLPCSGKSSKARELAAYLQNNLPQGEQRPVLVISEEDHGAHRATEYVSSMDEKKARGNLISSIERNLSRERIVIADGLNYIKGYRYQLYCLARAVGTPHCVLFCVASERDCQRRNVERLQRDESSYPTSVLEELCLRYEEPNNQNRWDSPLFTTELGEDMDWSPLATTLMGNVARPPSLSTAPKTTNSGDFILQLDRITQGIVESIMQQLKTRPVPCRLCPTTDSSFSSSSSSSSSSSLEIRRPVMSSDLQRLRRQFIHMNRLHPVDASNIQSLFIQYLEKSL